MAIKIIDEKPHKSVVKKVICKECGVTLEYVPLDVKERKVHDYGGGVDIIRFIPCPKCMNEVEVR